MARKPKRNPSFFKVLIGDFMNKLRIPSAFVKNFKGNVPTSFTLESDSGRSWRVTVDDDEGSYFFSGGWSNFAKDHCLETGDFLVFFLLGSSTFEVIIYNRTTCEKNTTNLTAKRPSGRPIVDRPNEETTRQNRASCSKKPRGVSRGRRIYRTTFKRDRNISEKIEFVSEVSKKHPSFVVVLKKYMKYSLFVPRCFAEETGMAMKTSTVIKDPKGGMWPLSINWDARMSQVRLGCGWSKFLQENDVVVGDTLLIEHIPNTGNSIHVKVISKALMIRK